MDIAEIKAEFYEPNKDKEKWMIVAEVDGSYSLHIHTKDSVHPAFNYAGKREVIARLMQVMETGPVAPQTWYESVCIGKIDYKSADIIAIKPEAIASQSEIMGELVGALEEIVSNEDSGFHDATLHAETARAILAKYKEGKNV